MSKISIVQFGNGIRKYFHTQPDKFLWKEGLFLYGSAIVDLAYLEDWLSAQPNYNKDISIRDNIVRMYGKDANQFIESTLDL